MHSRKATIKLLIFKLMTVVTPSDRPKSVRNRCAIDFFGDAFVLSCCPFDISVGIKAFVMGLSQISSFFSFSIHVQEANQK